MDSPPLGRVAGWFSHIWAAFGWVLGAVWQRIVIYHTFTTHLPHIYHRIYPFFFFFLNCPTFHAREVVHFFSEKNSDSGDGFATSKLSRGVLGTTLSMILDQSGGGKWKYWS
jgi:hypothetical protein